MARYRIVPERSQVWIDARSSLHPINTRTDGLEGYLDADIARDGGVNLEAPVAGKLSLAVERLRSGNPLEDRELRKRIDAKRFPTIDGIVTDMTSTGVDNRYLVTGDLAFRGVSREVRDELQLSHVDERTIRIEGRSAFDVRDFGMQPPRILMLKVDPEVSVRVDIVAERED